MSLRIRLFLLLAGLLALLLGAQWWLIRSLTRDLGSEVHSVVVSVGREVVEVLQSSEMEMETAMVAADGASDGVSGGASETAGVDVRVIRIEEENELGKQKRIMHILHPDDPGSLSSEELKKMAARELAVAKATSGFLEGPSPPHLEVMLLGSPDDEALVLKGPRLSRKIPIPLQGFGLRLDRFRSRLLAGTLVLLALGFVLAALMAHQVSRPLRILAAAAQRVGEGDLGVQVPEMAGGEVGSTLRAFNLMSGRLAQLETDSRRLREAEHLTELGEVSQGFAHSLRNPLNALGLSVDHLAEGEADEDRRRALAGTARQQIRRVDGALRTFLALASSGGEPEEVDVGVLLQDVALEALQDCRGQRHDDEAPPRLEVRPTLDLPPLRAVAPELRSVLQALVVNAVEASPPGGRVVLSAEPLGENRLRVFIQDEGPGLAPAVRERLFTPHVTSKAHGSGMGLFLAHRIATRRYDGSLVLEDLSPLGTRAVLELSHRLSAESSMATEGLHHG